MTPIKNLLIFCFCFTIISTPVFAYALETIYPLVPGLPPITDNSGLGDYVGYFFSLAIMAAGILAVIVLTLGAVRLISSAGNPGSRKEAADMIKGSVLGMVLLVSSFMLLRTINISLVTPSLTPLPAGEGIFYTNGADRKPAPMAESNTNNRPEGYDKILYDCSSGPALFVWKFPERNFEGIESAFVETISCGNSTDIAGTGSFKMAFRTPGIYYFLGDNCSGYMSHANTASGQVTKRQRIEAQAIEEMEEQADCTKYDKDEKCIEIELLKNKVKSIKIINNISGEMRYGVIFHGTDNPSESGPCSNPYFILDPSQEEECVSVPITSITPAGKIKTLSSSATIFVWNGVKPETSGTGVDFYSEPWGKYLGARAGKHTLSQKNIGAFWYGFAQKINFQNYSGNRPPAYKSLYSNFSQRAGSINLNGNYLVALYGKALYSENSEIRNCQIFFNNVFNIKETEFSAAGNNTDSVYVLPIK